MGRRGRQAKDSPSWGGLLGELLMAQLGLIVLLLLLGVAGWQVYSITQEVRRTQRLEEQLRATWLRRAELFERHRAVREEIERLRSDPEYRRRLLKQQMGYTEEGEIVVVFGGEER